MNKYRGRVETSKRGFIPSILDSDLDTVLDGAYVEYGTGCWIDKDSEPEDSFEAQLWVWTMFHGDIPSGYYVHNSCNDYRVCYNPNCLELLEMPDYEA